MFPKVPLPHLENKWLSKKNDKKIIDERMMQIEYFLQILLSSKDVKSNPGEVLKALGIIKNN